MVFNTSRGCSAMRASRPVMPTSPEGNLTYCGCFEDSATLVPTQQVFSQPSRDAEDEQDYHKDQQDQREHQGSVEGALRKRQEVAEAAGSRHKLPHAGAGEGKADGNFQIAKH